VRPSLRSKDDNDRLRPPAVALSTIPVIYVGDNRESSQNIKGVVYRFVRGIPMDVPIATANLLINKGNFKHASDVDVRKYQSPMTWVQSILVARTLHSIGDMLMASLTPKAIKQKYPRAKVTVAVPRESFPLWFHNPWVDELVDWYSCQYASRRYDLFFDITRPCVRYEMANHPSRKQRIDIYMEHCGGSLPDDEKQPFYLVTQDERDWAAKVTGGRYFFGIQLRANAPIRNWMAGENCPQDRNKEIVKRWLGLDNGVDVLLFDEHQQLVSQYEGPRIFKRPGSNIREVFALMERCALMLTLDSGLLHGCGALTIPAVALFGNIHPDARTRYYQGVKPLFKPEACIHQRGPCNGDCGHQHCLEGITVDECWGMLKKVWDEHGRRRLEVMKANPGMKGRTEP
jgi:hypothetical protein